MTDRFNGDEINVEGIAADHAVTFPFEDAVACRDILQMLSIIVEAGIVNRAARKRRDGDQP